MQCFVLQKGFPYQLTSEAFPPLYAMINNSFACPYEFMMNGRNENERCESFFLPSNPSSLQLECLAISQTPSPQYLVPMQRTFACVVVVAARKYDVKMIVQCKSTSRMFSGFSLIFAVSCASDSLRMWLEAGCKRNRILRVNHIDTLSFKL